MLGVLYVLYDPARPRFCSTAEAVWGDLYSARKFGKFGLSLVPTHYCGLSIVPLKVLWIESSLTIENSLN